MQESNINSWHSILEMFVFGRNTGIKMKLYRSFPVIFIKFRSHIALIKQNRTCLRPNYGFLLGKAHPEPEDNISPKLKQTIKKSPAKRGTYLA